jgi:molybdenum cofactor cytidylyltransferase
MKFGPVAIADAVGAMLAHSVNVGGKRWRKSHRMTREDVETLRLAGVESLVVATLDPDDLDEDRAAERIASVLNAEDTHARPPGTGRVNIHADRAGVFRVERAVVDAVNRIDPDITLATLADFAAVEAGQMVATVKIIPFAVHRRLVDAAVEALRQKPAFSLHPFTARRVAVIQTSVAGTKPAVLDKTTTVTAARLSRSGSTISSDGRTAHETAALTQAIGPALAGADMAIVFGASAVSDKDDVIPAAIRAAGGEVERVGMPVDPGNLLVMGSLDGKPVIGAPGCARSPKPNGFDWVLDRIMADIPVTSGDIAGLGVGGLLMEIPTRPQPREAAAAPAKVSLHAIVLAAGRSSRMGESNKLMAAFDGKPLARRTTERVVAAGLDGVVAIVGHQAGRLRDILAGLDVKVVENPDYATGLASSLKAGLQAVRDKADGIMVVLADMPEVTSEAFGRLAAAFRESRGQAIVRATHGGKRGNPVILPRSLFGQIEALEGDTGARQIMETSELRIIDVELGSAASLDVDTPEAMERAGGVLVG